MKTERAQIKSRSAVNFSWMKAWARDRGSNKEVNLLHTIFLHDSQNCPVIGLHFNFHL